VIGHERQAFLSARSRSLSLAGVGPSGP
jgi:hypothetical protein